MTVLFSFRFAVPFLCKARRPSHGHWNSRYLFQEGRLIPLIFHNNCNNICDTLINDIGLWTRGRGCLHICEAKLGNCGLIIILVNLVTSYGRRRTHWWGTSRFYFLTVKAFTVCEWCCCGCFDFVVVVDFVVSKGRMRGMSLNWNIS